MLEWIASRADVFHVSNQLRRNIPKRPRITATLHDLTCWLMPELHTAANVRADHFFAEHTLQRADGLIAVSENTRQDAIRILGIAPEKIVTIHSGVPAEYFNAIPLRRAKPYVLFVGTIEPRKNLETLLEAWSGMRFREDFDLVIAGPAGWSSEHVMARLTSGEPGVKYPRLRCGGRDALADRRGQPRSSIRRCMKASVFPWRRRWPRAYRWSRRTPHAFLRSPARAPCLSIRRVSPISAPRSSGFCSIQSPSVLTWHHAAAPAPRATPGTKDGTRTKDPYIPLRVLGIFFGFCRGKLSGWSARCLTGAFLLSSHKAARPGHLGKARPGFGGKPQ